MRSLNLDQMQSFLEVVEPGSFLAATRGRLNLTQPAVSLRVPELEQRFGGPATAPGRLCFHIGFPTVGGTGFVS